MIAFTSLLSSASDLKQCRYLCWKHDKEKYSCSSFTKNSTSAQAVFDTYVASILYLLCQI